MKKLIVIPTYWTFKKDVRKNVFDHPTLFRGKDTITRCLKSINDCGIQDQIMIFPSPTNPVIEKKIEKIITPYKDINISMFKSSDLKHINDFLKKSKVSREFRSKIKMDTYPNIRNLGLLMAQKEKYDLVVQIDDDSIIENKKLIDEASDSIGNKILGKKMWGKTGYYVDKNNNWKLKQKNPNKRKLWLKETYMNETFKKSILSKKRYTETTMALGGCMVNHKNIFSRIPYDPYNTRGEDGDYLINCKYFKLGFFFDNKLKVKHIPPKRVAPYWCKFRQDVYRFIYLRQKIKTLNIDPSELDPYPGVFLKKNLEKRLISTSANYAQSCLNKRELKDASDYIKNSTEILFRAKTRAKIYEKSYLKFKKEWEKVMLKIRKNF